MPTNVTRSTRASRSIRSLIAVAVVAGGMLAAAPVNATAPERFGPNTFEGTFIGFNCDGFDIEIAGGGTERVTVFFDASDNVNRIAYYGRFPHDVLTNTVTGRSIVVRGEFQEFIEPIPGSDNFTKTIVGFRYMINEPGLGATIRDVGRISYAEVEQLHATFQAGEHDLALDEALWGTFCGALD